MHSPGRARAFSLPLNVASTPSLHLPAMPTSEEPGLKFIVVGASIAGLTSAIALKRSGHTVLVLEKEPHWRQARGLTSRPSGGARVPPNGCKILFDWGLEDEVRKNAVVGEGLWFYKYVSNGKGADPDYLGPSLWHPELLHDARGDFLQMRHRDLLQMLHHAAVEDKTPEDSASSGTVTVLFEAEVMTIDFDACSVTLRSGETHAGDAIIGADGVSGVVRKLLIQESSGDKSVARDGVPTGLSVYSTFIPKAVAMEHEELAKLYEYPRSKMVNVFMGENRAAKVSIAGKDEDVLLGLYTPDGSQDGTWTEEARDIREVVGSCNILLQGLAEHAGPSSCVQIKTHYELESWVSKSGKVAAIGEAAHPFPPASTHACSIAIEDGAFIGKIFSHTRNPNRVKEFLYAFEKHRRPRCAYIFQAEKKSIEFFTLIDGETQAVRDTSMRANHAAGIDVMLAPEADMQRIWDDFYMVFDYEPTDDADEWWVSWGRFRDGPSTREDNDEFTNNDH